MRAFKSKLKFVIAIITELAILMTYSCAITIVVYKKDIENKKLTGKIMTYSSIYLLINIKFT